MMWATITMLVAGCEKKPEAVQTQNTAAKTEEVKPKVQANQLTEKEIYASEPFVGNNMWVTGLKDPDGYSLYFESPTNVTEGTILSDWLKMKG